jgi:hypothetical protein
MQKIKLKNAEELIFLYLSYQQGFHLYIQIMQNFFIYAFN